MENLHLASSAKTPEVTFDLQNGTLLLKGRSIPENSIEFYKPLYDWVDAYASQAKAETTIDVKLEYFNTSSSKCLLDLFKKLERLNTGGSSVNVNWYYEEDDEDMAEAGEDYQAIIKLPFKMVEIKEI
ncbi:MAG: DUF1987 domain-containing protein [Cryomorphaceae bacterium]|jgi:hypothetical protein|nr:DUF1987 domain-containing protein [Cryomorphaceae bacterium]